MIFQPVSFIGTIRSICYPQMLLNIAVKDKQNILLYGAILIDRIPLSILPDYSFVLYNQQLPFVLSKI